MGTAAVAARLAFAKPRSSRDNTASCGLVFDDLGGPVVAVCGLAGGVGTSTFALALARQAARESSTPVLLTESDSHGAGLSVLIGHETPHSLTALARAIAEGDQPSDTFLDFASGLRVIAAAARREAPAPSDSTRALLDQARSAHGLVVIDCGTDCSVTSHATHIIWTIAGTRAGLASGTAVFDSDLLPTANDRPEVLVARADPAQPGATARALRRLAKRRCTRLVLAAQDAGIGAADGPPSEPTLRALGAVAPVLRNARR